MIHVGYGKFLSNAFTNFYYACVGMDQIDAFSP